MNRSWKKSKCRPRCYQPRVAFVACKDPMDKLQKAARRCGVDGRWATLMSTKDNPTLSTIEGIVSALPPSIEYLFLDDVEQLLPEGKRDPKSVKAFMREVGNRYAHLRIEATYTDDSLPPHSSKHDSFPLPVPPGGHPS